jgi:hypothetical protein
LYAAAVKVKIQATFGPPRCRSLQQTDRLHPPKDFFDQLALPLTDRVARMPRRPAIDGTAAVPRRGLGEDLFKKWLRCLAGQRGDRSVDPLELTSSTAC